MSHLFTRSTSTRHRLGTLAKVVPVLAVVSLLAACSSGAPTSTSTSTAKAAGAGSGGKGVSIVVIGGASDDPFFSVVKNGVDAAAKVVEAAGGKVTYLTMPNYSNIGPDAAKLDKTALSLNPSVVVSTDWVPDAQDATLKSITAAGVALIIYNSGTLAQAKADGGFTYIGADYTVSGVQAAKSFLAAGAKNVVFVNTTPGDASAEDLGTGYKTTLEAGGSKYTELNLPGSSFSNQTAIAQAVKAALQNDPTIDGIAAWGTQAADASYSAMQQAGVASKVKLIGFNLSANTLNRIQAGTQLGTIDQQPYAQGFYSVMAAYQYAAYGIQLPTAPIQTGPLIVDKSNVGKAIAGTAEGVR